WDDLAGKSHGMECAGELRGPKRGGRGKPSAAGGARSSGAVCAARNTCGTGGECVAGGAYAGDGAPAGQDTCGPNAGSEDPSMTGSDRRRGRICNCKAHLLAQRPGPSTHRAGEHTPELQPTT